MKYVLLILTLTLHSCRQNDSEVSEKTSSNTLHGITKTEKAFKFADSTFKSFYYRFKSDSMFQTSRIKFPIKGKYQSYDEEKNWSKEKWVQMTWDLRAEINNPNDSVFVSQDSNKFFFGTYCLDCGFSFEMQFDKLEGAWFLTYRQENNY